MEVGGSKDPAIVQVVKAAVRGTEMYSLKVRISVT